MKRVLGMLGVIGLTALITYLAVSRHLSDQRAEKLDRALLEAEQRIVQLEAEIDAAKAQLSENRRCPKPLEFQKREFATDKEGILNRSIGARRGRSRDVHAGGRGRDQSVGGRLGVGAFCGMD